MSEKAKNREEAKRVVSWELREASAMLLSAWKNTVSDFFLFCFFPFQRALESSSVVSSRWESMLRWTGAENGLGCVKQLPLTLANAPKWRTRRSKGPVAQSSSQAGGFFYKTPKKTKTSNCRRTYKEPVSDCYIWMDSNNVITKPLNNVKHHLTFTKDKNVSYLININISVFISAGVFIM